MPGRRTALDVRPLVDRGIEMEPMPLPLHEDAIDMRDWHPVARKEEDVEQAGG
jgi:hypothetical protein